MPKESPILVRIFKEESELEVWKQDAEGNFALLKTYPICRWSGELGPKVKEGDRQAPEGFYNITPGQMNPNSNYYLAFNLGFPNTYDRANDRTGAFLMVHGDCSSSGCYAMTDEQIQEIYALGRDSFLGGQKSFQVQAYPFRMTPLNMARHRNSPNMAFWRMIKEGNDYFEVTRREPQVDVCEKHYVFDARTPANATPISFRPRDKCPIYEVDPEVAAAVKEKEAHDERAFTEYANRGTSTVAVRTGTDGGMHPLFQAKLREKPLIDLSSLTRDDREINKPTAPLPPDVNPPRAPNPDTTSSIAATGAAIGASMSRLFRFGGGEIDETTTYRTVVPSPAPPKTVAAAHPAPAPVKPPAVKPAAAPLPAATPTAVATQSAPAKPTAASPASFSNGLAPPPAVVAPAANPSLMAGATPVVPTGSFESRWGGLQ